MKNNSLVTEPALFSSELCAWCLEMIDLQVFGLYLYKNICSPGFFQILYCIGILYYFLFNFP